MCPHVGDTAAGFIPAFHGVPGPVQVTVAPSPVDHMTRFGVAVAVTLNPGTDAVAERGLHDELSIQSHVGTYMTWADGFAGLVRISGAGSRSSDTACRANTAGLIGDSESGRHTNPTRSVPSHDCRYHEPGPTRPAGGGPPSYGR